MKDVIIGSCLLILFLAQFGCTKNTDQVRLTPVPPEKDFRDTLVGDYRCMTTYFYFCPVGDTMHWCTDTISYDDIINISKSGDSSILVFHEEGANSDYSFIGHYLGDNYFECLECNGPPDYARFFGTDSVKVFRKAGVTNSYQYYGKIIIIH